MPICSNCKASFSGAFCSECGTKHSAPNQNWKEQRNETTKYAQDKKFQEKQEKEHKIQEIVDSSDKSWQKEQQQLSDSVEQARFRADREKKAEFEETRRRIEREAQERIVREKEDDKRLHAQFIAVDYNRSVDDAIDLAQKKATEEMIAKGLACIVCWKSLKDSGPFVKKDGKPVHRACLKCGKCNGPVLISGPIVLREHLLICGNCAGIAPIPGSFCSKCKEKIEPNAKFCESCGCKFN